MRCGPILLVLRLPACSPAAEDRAAVEKRLTFSILEEIDKGQALEEVACDFDRVRELGVTGWRGSFGWDDYEPEPGRYDFESLHRFAALAAERGITLRPYIGYTPSAGGCGRQRRPPLERPAG